MNTSMPESELKVADGLDLYLAPVLIVAGGVCNTLVILVMRAPFFAHVSTSLYMSVNAVVDNISLLVALPFHWLHVNYPETLNSRGDHSQSRLQNASVSLPLERGSESDALCKFLHFTGWCTSDMGIALTVAMTFERAFAVKFPLRAASFCTRRKARIIIVCIFLMMLAKDGQFIFKSQMVNPNITSYMCELDTDDSSAFYHYANHIWPIMHNVFVFASFIVIIASNVIIIKNVRDTSYFPDASYKTSSTSLNFNTSKLTSLKSKFRHRGRNGGRRSSTSRSRQLTIMLISDSLTIILCTLPFALLDAIRPHVNIHDAGTNHLVFSVSFYLLYVNRCANFFLYCVSGERFRLGLKQICVRERLVKGVTFSNLTSGRRGSTVGVTPGSGTTGSGEISTIS